MRAATSHLAEVCEINPGTSFAFDADQLCSFVPMEAVDDEFAQIVKFPLKRFDQVAKGYTTFADNDVIVAKITPCMENGKCAVVHKLRNGIGFGSTEFHVLRATTRVLPEWLFYFWRFPQIRKYAERNMTGTAGQKRVPSSFLERLEIPVPPLREQERITALLEKADRLRRTRRYARQLSDTFLQSVFLEMFAGKESCEWPQEAIEDLAADKANAIRTGPFGSQLLHSEFVSEGVAVLGIDNAVQNRFVWAKPRFITAQKYAELKRYTVSPGDVLITLMGTCGRCAVVPDKTPLAINTKHLCCISINQVRCRPTYLHACFLNHPQVLKRLGVSERGAVMPGLNMQLIKELVVPVPPLPLQQTFADIVRRFERLRAQQREAERQAEHLFQTLLYEAFKGEQ